MRDNETPNLREGPSISISSEAVSDIEADSWLS